MAETQQQVGAYVDLSLCPTTETPNPSYRGGVSALSFGYLYRNPKEYVSVVSAFREGTSHLILTTCNEGEFVKPDPVAYDAQSMTANHAALAKSANVDLRGATTIATLAECEDFSGDDYALALVKRIGITDLSISQQISRLQALAGIATNASPGNVTAEELARHYAIAYALYERFSLLAADCASSGKTRAAGVYMSAATSASRASLSVLNALESLRQQANQAPTKALTG